MWVLSGKLVSSPSSSLFAVDILKFSQKAFGHIGQEYFTIFSVEAIPLKVRYFAAMMAFS
jgi:hypothetical protein